MKKSVVLLLVFIGYQFLVSLGFVLSNYLLERPDPMSLTPQALAWASLLSGGLLIGHLFLCREVTFSTCSWTKVPGRCMLWCLPLVLSAMYFLNAATELLQLPNLNEKTFLAMSRYGVGVVAMAVVAPLAEELLFRGAILRHLLRQGHRASYALVVSSALFAIVHGNPAQIPFAFLLGLLLGWLYYRTGSVLPAVLCHFLNNGIAVLLMRVAPEATASGQELAGGSVGFYGGMFLSLLLFAFCFYRARRFFPRQTEGW